MCGYLGGVRCRGVTDNNIATVGAVEGEPGAIEGETTSLERSESTMFARDLRENFVQALEPVVIPEKNWLVEASRFRVCGLPDGLEGVVEDAC